MGEIMGNEMLISVKILGERNSGTNFLRASLKDNFQISLFPSTLTNSRFQKFLLTRAVIPLKTRTNMMEQMEEKWHRDQLHTTGGWKHAKITSRFIEGFFMQNECHAICTIRHPLAWARSMQNNPFNVIGDVSEDFDIFINAPWRTRLRDEMDCKVLPSLLVLWREKVSKYIEYAAQYENFHIIRYEDLLLKPEESFHQLSQFLPLKTETPQLPTRHIRPFVTNEDTKDAYLIKARTTSLSELSEKTRKPFMEHIGQELIDTLGYS